MAREWAMLRVGKDTVRMLEDIRKRFQSAAEKGQRALEMDDRGRVSLDQIVQELCYRYLGDQARKERSRKKKKEARAAQLRDELAKIKGELGQDGLW